MPAPRTTLWNMPALTPIKHRILRRYLERWLPDLLREHDRIYILDGFCGPGEYTKGEKGSPLIIIDVLLSCIDDPELRSKVILLFMDEDDRRCCYLHDLLNKQKRNRSEIASLKYYIETGPFASKLTTKLSLLEKSRAVLPPTFAFIDPFGYSDIPMSIIARLAQYQRCDVLITWMYEEINRFLAHPDAIIQQYITDVFGTEQWRSLDLTGDRERQLCQLYCSQLCIVGNMQYVCMFRLKNRRNLTDYFLVFATHRRESIEMIKDVFWEVDPICGYTYSLYEQARRNKQPRLFPSEPDYGILTKQLLAHFCGTSITLCAIEEYILAATPFRRAGWREHVLKRLKLTSRISITSANPDRRPGEYTETDCIHFL